MCIVDVDVYVYVGVHVNVNACVAAKVCVNMYGDAHCENGCVC